MVKLEFQFSEFNFRRLIPNHTNNKYLLSMKHVPGFVLDTGCKMGNKITSVSALMELTFYQRARQEREARNK